MNNLGLNLLALGTEGLDFNQLQASAPGRIFPVDTNVRRSANSGMVSFALADTRKIYLSAENRPNIVIPSHFQRSSRSLVCKVSRITSEIFYTLTPIFEQ